VTRKRKQTYPPAKTSTRRAPPAGPEVVIDRPTLVTINQEAKAGRSGFAVGDRVRIDAAGLFAGETAVIERMSPGVIPSALVRTDAGRTRQVRTIDLVPVGAEPVAKE